VNAGGQGIIQSCVLKNVYHISHCRTDWPFVLGTMAFG
jgi:hypothetical protein